MNDRVFVDTNIIVYAFSNNEPIKKQKARDLLDAPFVISMQVLFEFINVSIKKLGYTKIEAIENAEGILLLSELVFENENTLKKSLTLLKRYNLQIFDSKIVASALTSDCAILYSEDMQDGLVIENKLRIINPFLNK